MCRISADVINLVPQGDGLGPHAGVILAAASRQVSLTRVEIVKAVLGQTFFYYIPENAFSAAHTDVAVSATGSTNLGLTLTSGTAGKAFLSGTISTQPSLATVAACGGSGYWRIPNATMTTGIYPVSPQNQGALVVISTGYVENLLYR